GTPQPPPPALFLPPRTPLRRDATPRRRARQPTPAPCHGDATGWRSSPQPRSLSRPSPSCSAAAAAAAAPRCMRLMVGAPTVAEERTSQVILHQLGSKKSAAAATTAVAVVSPRENRSNSRSSINSRWCHDHAT
ncbi:unnamed protein product, partial [Ectocarpus sp. 8 AP-2014]